MCVNLVTYQNYTKMHGPKKKVKFCDYNHYFRLGLTFVPGPNRLRGVCVCVCGGGTTELILDFSSRGEWSLLPP